MRIRSILCGIMGLAALANGQVRLAITSSSPLPNGTVSQSYFYQLAATESSGLTWGIFTDTSGPSALPPGLTLDAPTGIISGTPTQAGTFGVTIQVMDKQQQFATKAFTLTINPPSTGGFEFQTFFLPDGMVGVSYSQMIMARGGTPPYNFSLQSGSQLPDGLVLDSAGDVAGTPTKVGSFTFTVLLVDSARGSVPIPRSFTINIVLPLTILTNSPLASATAGIYYSQPIVASGGTPPYKFAVTRGALPAGLALGADGSLTGTVAQAGTSTFTVQVTDAGLLTVSKDFQLNVLNYVPALQVAPATVSLSGASSGDAVSQELTITSTNGQPTNFTLQVDGGQPNTPAPAWLRVVPPLGATPGRITVIANPSSLIAANYTARIRVLNATDPTQLPIDVPVTFGVATVPPQLDVSPSALRFSARMQSGGIIDQTIAVRNAGSGPLGFSVTIPSPAPPWITVTPTTGQVSANSPVYVRVRVNTQGLNVAGYRAVVRFTAGTTSIDVPVELFVSDTGAILGVDIIGARIEARQGNGTSEPQTIRIFNFGDPSSTVNWSAEVISGGEWLNLSTTSGTATATNPGTLILTTNSRANTMLAGGSYALLRITDPQALNSPQYVPVTLDIEDAAQPPRPDPVPKGIVYTGSVGGPAPASRLVRVYTSNSTAVNLKASAAASDGSSWLSVSPTTTTVSSSSPAQLTVSVNLSGLKPGIYTGNINVAILNEVRSVSVTLILTSAATSPAEFSARLAAGCSPTRLVVTHNGLPDNFTVPAGFPATVSVFLNDDCGTPVTTGSVSARFSNGDPALSLRSDLMTGLYTATWQPGKVSAQTTITVQATSGTLTPASAQISGAIAQNSAPVLFPGGTVNAFYEKSGILAPGTVAEVFGSGLASGTLSPPLPLPTSFNGTAAILGGLQPPLFFLSNGQLNLQIPAELQAGRQYQMVVSVNGAITLPDTLDVNPVQPGVLAFPDGHIVAQRPGDLTLVDAGHPAKPGEVLTLYALGMGATNPLVASGQLAPATEPLARVAVQPTVMVNGANADILYAGLTPGAIGLYQINIRVPDNAPSGDLDVAVTQNGIAANPAKLIVGR